MSTTPNPRAILTAESHPGRPSPLEVEKMARRRFQEPEPAIRGNWWTLLIWQDEFQDGKFLRKRKRIRLAPRDAKYREVKRMASEILHPMNQGRVSIASAVKFSHYVEKTYIPLRLPIYSKSTRDRYQGVIDNYLLPQFGNLSLREMTPVTLQTWFSMMASSKLSYESKDKIRDVLASIMTSAIEFQLIKDSPTEKLRIPRDRKPKRVKPWIRPEQFHAMLEMIPEPYATMVYVAVYTGLRVSELAGLRWNDVHPDSITVDERYCRGDWDEPKSDASNATIAANQAVIARIHRMKALVVSVRAGRATRVYRVVKSSNPEDLVFQSVRDGVAMRDNNILVRHIKPAACTLGVGFVNWRVLRRSHATWLKMAGADLKDTQAQMRHAHMSTTADIYQQPVPEMQRRAVERLTTLVLQ
jgi:integrase